MKEKTLAILACILIINIGSYSYADSFYWKAEYDAVVQEKNNIDAELQILKEKYQEDTLALKKQINDLNKRIEELNTKLETLQILLESKN